MSKDLTGLLLVFIGLIIGIFTGFGFVLTLIGLFMLAKRSQNFRNARNSFIGTLITSIVGFFVLIGMGGVLAFSFSSRSLSGTIAGLIACIIVMIAYIVIICFFNINSFKFLLSGCRELALEKGENTLADDCERAYKNYKNALVFSTIFSSIYIALIWVPILNVLLALVAIGIGIWYLVSQIFVIIRVWQTYDRCK